MTAYADVNMCKNMVNGTFLADPNNCKNFIICDGGQSWIMHCPESSLYSVREKLCIPAEEAECSTRNKI